MSTTLTETVPPTRCYSNPIRTTSAGHQASQPDQANRDTQHPGVGLATNSESGGGDATIMSPNTRSAASLTDPALGLASDIFDDLEATKIANQNRLRQLTGTAVDGDGIQRQQGHEPHHADVVRLTALVDMLDKAEHQADLHLRNVMRRHPLWQQWAKDVPGLGDRQFARLLAVVGDPYLRDVVTPGETEGDAPTISTQPRTVSQLWAYCGYVPGQKRKRGEQSNWSTLAKTRAYLIVEVCVRLNGEPDKNGRARARSPYRDVYDARKAATEGRLHVDACVRCGPSGKPAQPGVPWSDAHRHADALRVAAKRLLQDMWCESKRIHDDRASR